MTVIAPGHHLYPSGDGSWRYSTPDERFVRVTGDPAVLRVFQAAVHGDGVVGEETLDSEHRKSLHHLGEMFAERGLLDPSPEPAPTGAGISTIHVEGDNALALAVARMLAGSAQVIHSPVDEGAVRTTDVVISCAGWLPDARWRQLDDWCTAAGVASHRAYVEGTRFFLGPLTVPNHSASYHDLRGRRLAASGVAEELLTHWAYLDDDVVPAAPVPWPDEAGIAVLAGLLALDVRNYLATGRAAWPNAQLGIDLHTGRVKHHPVLPLPVTATR